MLQLHDMSPSSVFKEWWGGAPRSQSGLDGVFSDERQHSVRWYATVILAGAKSRRGIWHQHSGTGKPFEAVLDAPSTPQKGVARFGLTSSRGHYKCRMHCFKNMWVGSHRLMSRWCK